MPDTRHAHVHPHTHDHAKMHGQAPRHREAPRAAPALRASWLRQSALQRLAGAGVAIALIWAAVLWAMR